MESWCNSVFHNIHDWSLSHGVTENLQSRTLTHHGNLNKKWKIIKFHCFINLQWHRLKTKCCIDQRRGISISQCIVAVIVSNISTWSDAMKQKWICYVLKSLYFYRSLDVSIARVVKEGGGGVCAHFLAKMNRAYLEYNVNERPLLFGCQILFLDLVPLPR